MRKQGLFTLAFMLMLPFTAFADATATPPPSVTMESATGGSAGRVIGGPKAMYDGATAQNGIKINWPYVNHNGVNVCQLGVTNRPVDNSLIGCSVGYCTASGGNLRAYGVGPEGVIYSRCGSRQVYAWES